MLNRKNFTINPAILAEAAEWFALLGSDSVSKTDHEQWQAWLNSHPDHRAAWSRVEFFTDKFNSLPTHTRSNVLDSTDMHRRQTLKTLAILSAVGLSSWKLWQSPYWREWTADYRTQTGSVQTITLADGTRITLDTATAINVEFNNDLRRIQLLAGEVYIETAPDKGAIHRPFVINCAQGQVRALGTRFSVQQQADHSRTAVFAGAVEIQPAEPESAKQTLKAGQETRFTRQHADTPHPIDSSQPAWVGGFLLADNLPLSEFVLQLNRYRHGYITCAPEIAHLRVVGSFPLKDIDRILVALEETFPVKVSKPAPLWTRIEPR